MHLQIQTIENGELKESYTEYVQSISYFGSSLCINNRPVCTINRKRIHTITVHRDHWFERIGSTKRKIKAWLNEN